MKSLLIARVSCPTFVSLTLSIVCEPCGRRGRYSVAKLMAEHGDAKLTDLLQTSLPEGALRQHP